VIKDLFRHPQRALFPATRTGPILLNRFARKLRVFTAGGGEYLP
jgi:hypothetical protein